MTDYIKIPLDPTGEPCIVDGMKAEFIGEFSFPVSIIDEKGNDYIDIPYAVPWTTCKEIYKSMAKFAAKPLELSDEADAGDSCICDFADGGRCNLPVGKGCPAYP